MKPTSRSSPAGRPEMITTSAGPWDSPAVVYVSWDMRRGYRRKAGPRTKASRPHRPRGTTWAGPGTSRAGLSPLEDAQDVGVVVGPERGRRGRGGAHPACVGGQWPEIGRCAGQDDPGAVVDPQSRPCPLLLVVLGLVGPHDHGQAQVGADAGQDGR